jgi:hypothetical protein
MAATTPNTLSTSEYWMSPDALTIELNALDNPQYLQVSLLAGSVITAYRQDVIDYDASLNYRKWTLQAYNNFFDRTDRAYVYAQLEKEGNTALIIYSYDILELTETVTSDTEESREVYNVYLGTISSSVNSNGESIPRIWEDSFKTGSFSTDKNRNEEQLGEWAKMFRLNKVTDMIEVLKDITSAVIHKLYIGARKIMINDVQTSYDSENDLPASDSIIPTTKFLKESTEEKFHRKDKTDENPFWQRFLGGASFGEFIDSLIAGKGAGIFDNGEGQFESLKVRSSLIVKELIYNRWFAQEGNVTYSEAGTIEQIELLEDGTYDLYLRRRWDNDITAFKEQDVSYGSVNNLNSTGEYYDSWFRVLSVMQAENKLNVVLYPDEEVPGGKNYPPAVGMVITRRGNAVDEERQGFWYISSYEGCICMLDGVTKPVLEESNYSIIIGKLKRLELFDNLPINYRQSYVYCRGIAIQDLMRIDYQGVVVVQLNDRGFWSLEVAQSENPYKVGKDTVDTVWHFGCRWKCLVTGTTDEPRYASTGWAMIEGNPEFTIDIEADNGWVIDDTELVEDTVIRTITLSGKLYNGDVTEHILDSDVTWTRDTGNVAEDNAWAIKRADAGKTLTITLDDLGIEFTQKGLCSFKATALLRDGQDVQKAEIEKSF